MKKYTLAQLHRMSEEEIDNILVLTLNTCSDKDLYLDKLDSGQCVISYGEHIQAVFNTFDSAYKYFNKITS